MAHSLTNDDLLVNMLVNKAKLAQPSTTVSNQTVVSVEKQDVHNQILTLEERLNKLEKDVEAMSMYIISYHNNNITKLKKE